MCRRGSTISPPFAARDSILRGLIKLSSAKESNSKSQTKQTLEGIHPLIMGTDSPLVWIIASNRNGLRTLIFNRHTPRIYQVRVACSRRIRITYAHVNIYGGRGVDSIEIFNPLFSIQFL